MKLQNKTAIITGASRGIGRATAMLFAQEGARVVVNYKTNLHLAEAVVGEIKQTGGIAIPVQADVSTEKGVKKLVSETLRRFNTIDVLVNNAGEIIRPGDWKTDVSVWQKTIDANVTSNFLMTREIAPIMLRQNSGSIVNLTSIFGILGGAAVLAYTASKGAIVTMTKGFAKELAPYIRVNAVAPSNVMTDMTWGAGEKLIEVMRKATLLKRIAEPDEIARGILFLASDDASYITGEILTIDGGFSLK